MTSSAPPLVATSNAPVSSSTLGVGSVNPTSTSTTPIVPSTAVTPGLSVQNNGVIPMVTLPGVTSPTPGPKSSEAANPPPPVIPVMIPTSATAASRKSRSSGRHHPHPVHPHSSSSAAFSDSHKPLHGAGSPLDKSVHPSPHPYHAPLVPTSVHSRQTSSSGASVLAVPPPVHVPLSNASRTLKMKPTLATPPRSLTVTHHKSFAQATDSRTAEQKEKDNAALFRGRSTADHRSVVTSTSTALAPSEHIKATEIRNNSILASTENVSQTPVVPFKTILAIVEPHVKDYFQIPRAIPSNYDVCQDLIPHQGKCTHGPDSTHYTHIPTPVVHALRNAILAVRDDLPLFSDEERDEFRRSRDLIAHPQEPTSLYEVMERGLPICLRPPGGPREFYRRTKFELVSSFAVEEAEPKKWTDLAETMFEFVPSGLPVVNSETSEWDKVNPNSSPFANMGPNQSKTLEEAQILAQYEHVYKVAHHSMVRTLPKEFDYRLRNPIREDYKTNPKALSNLILSFADLVKDAATRTPPRDFISLDMPWGTLASQFGFDPDNIQQQNQKAHIDLVSVLCESYSSCVLDKYACDLSLATATHHGNLVEWVRNAFPGEAVLPRHGRVRAHQERAFAPDLCHGPPSVHCDPQTGRVRFGTNRLFFENNRSEEYKEILDTLVNDFFGEVPKTFVLEQQYPGNLWFSLPCVKTRKEKGKVLSRERNACHSSLHFLISAMLPDLLLRCAPKQVVEHVIRKFGDLAHRVLHPFLTDNADEIHARIKKEKEVQLITEKEARAQERAKRREERRQAREEERNARRQQLEEQVEEAERKRQEKEEELRQLEEDEEEKRQQQTEDEEEERMGTRGSGTDTDTQAGSIRSEEDVERKENPVGSGTEEEQEEEEEKEQGTDGEETKGVDVATSGDEGSATDAEPFTMVDSSSESVPTHARQWEDRLNQLCPSWSLYNEEERQVLVYMARQCICDPNQPLFGTSQTRTFSVLDPISNGSKLMSFGVILDAVMAKELITGIFHFLDVSYVYAQLKHMSILLRPKMGIQALHEHLSHLKSLVTKPSEMAASPHLSALFLEPFNPHLRLRFVFRQLLVKDCFEPLSFDPVSKSEQVEEEDERRLSTVVEATEES